MKDWSVLHARLNEGEYEIEAEYTVRPDACIKCAVVGNILGVSIR